MKQRLIAALAAVGIVTALSGLGTIPAYADEATDTETVVDQTTQPEPADPTPADPPVDQTDPNVVVPSGDPTIPPVEPTNPPVEPTDPAVDPEGETDPNATQSFARLMNEPAAKPQPTLEGEEGEFIPWDKVMNDPDYWKNYPDHTSVCYKHEAGKKDGDNNAHGRIEGKTVILNAFDQSWPGDHWELLVIKGGSESVNVVKHPAAGTAYASPVNNGGQQAGVSYWIVCKGTTPPVEKIATATVKTTPPTCEVAGTVVADQLSHATLGTPSYNWNNNTYTVKAAAENGYKFAVGDGTLNGDRTEKTFTGPIQPKLDGAACKVVPPPPGHEDQTCVDYEKIGGSITVYYQPGDLDGKLTYKITGPNGYVAFPTVANPTVTGLAPGDYKVWVTGKAGYKPYPSKFDVKIDKAKDCEKKVDVVKPKVTQQECVDGQATGGAITISYLDGGVSLVGKVDFKISGPNLPEYTVTPPVDPATSVTIPLPAGTYTVKAVGVNGWKIKNGDKKWNDLKIKSINCDRVNYCHASDADNGKIQLQWFENMPAASLNGHKQHAADILPAYGDFGGLNLETVYGDKTGQEWLDSKGCPDVNVKGIEPGYEDEKCTSDGKPSDGSITLKFDGIEGKVKYHITGGPDDVDIWVESDDPHKVDLPAGFYTVTAHAIDPYNLWGKSSWDVKIDDVKCKVWIPEPEWGGEQCYEGETVDGYIAVNYKSWLIGKIQYRITGPNGFNEVVPAPQNPGWVYTDVAAGDYTVTAEPIGSWIVKGNSPYELTISSATNCQCYVPDDVKEKVAGFALIADIAPECAEASVTIGGPTCSANGSLKLNEPLHADWGDVEMTGLHYKVSAHAHPGFRFAPASEVSGDGFTKTFEGDLAPKKTDPTCVDLPNLPFDPPTLALTGGGTGSTLWIAGIALVLGIGGVVVAQRRSLRVERER